MAGIVGPSLMTREEWRALSDRPRNDRTLWRLIERNPSIAYKDECLAYDILVEAREAELVRQREVGLAPAPPIPI